MSMSCTNLYKTDNGECGSQVYRENAGAHGLTSDINNVNVNSVLKHAFIKNVFSGSTNYTQAIRRRGVLFSIVSFL